MSVEVILYTANGCLAIALGIMSIRQSAMNKNLHFLKHLVEGMGMHMILKEQAEKAKEQERAEV